MVRKRLTLSRKVGRLSLVSHAASVISSALKKVELYVARVGETVVYDVIRRAKKA